MRVIVWSIFCSLIYIENITVVIMPRANIKKKKGNEWKKE